MSGLKRTLNGFYRSYDFRERLLHDPIELPHRYGEPRDIEIAGFLASCFAYGKVELFKPVAEKLLSAMGESPSDFLHQFSLGRHARLFRGIQYRFNRNEDILCLLFLLHTVLRKEGSLEASFMKHCRDEDRDVGSALSGMISDFLSINTATVYGRNIRPAGLMQFFPSPERGSACKRQNLFLRWMVRDRDIDFGIWKHVPKNKLVIPLDTHIMRISLCLGFTRRRSADWKTAVEITEALRQLDPEDPLKYDFALCHHGISGLCKGVSGDGCRECAFGRHRTAH
ncbi:MAG TPA: TIGR02757 family protein [Thermodesulfovibrionales bacterium]|nr:TIGR02757 family protein [Thermodesulfovibrionales bacterium]